MCTRVLVLSLDFLPSVAGMLWRSWTCPSGFLIGTGYVEQMYDALVVIPFPATSTCLRVHDEHAI